MNGATVLTKFTGDTSDLEKKTESAKGALTGLEKAALSGIGAVSLIGGAYVEAGKLVAKFTSQAVQSAGELEQQIGGTKAVFGDFATTVQDKAKESFKTMGTSANDYMQTINKMSSILQGSGYTIEESMNTSMEVMQRAADVASVMGISTEEAMNAVTAAAKGNFMMMDNLGVKMTATSIEAYGLSKGIDKAYNSMTEGEKTALAYEMFLEKTANSTENYAKENKTFAGSIRTLTASWENFLSGAGSTQEVIDSAIGAIEAIIPKIIEMLPAIVNGLIELVNAVIPMLPDIIKTLLPALIEGTQLLIIGLIEALPDLVLAIAEMLPTLIPIIIDAIMAIIPALIDNLPLFIEAGFQLIGGLIAGIINALPGLLARMVEVTVKMIGALANLPNMAIDAGKNMMKGLWNGVKSMKDWVVNKVKDIGKSVLKGLKGILGISSPSKEFALIGKFSVLGYTEALDDMQKDVQKQVGETFGISPQLANSSALNYTPNVQVVNNITMKQDPLGQMVNDIKTFSGGSKNDYNYGMGV